MSTDKKVVVSNVENILEDDLEITKINLEVEDIVEENSDSTLDNEEDFQSIDDLPDDQEIWTDGPSAGQVKEWKKIYGDVYVTSITYDKHVAWRCLNRAEYKQIVKKMEQLVQGGQLTTAEANLWNEETIAETCMLFPVFDKNKAVGFMAGVPSLIAQEVLEASGFVALEVRQL